MWRIRIHATYKTCMERICHTCVTMHSKYVTNSCEFFCEEFVRIIHMCVGWLCWGLTSQSTIFQSCRDGAIASWVINQYFRGVKCLAQGHNTAAVGLEPRTSRSGVRHSTTEPPRSPHMCEKYEVWILRFNREPLLQWSYTQTIDQYFCNLISSTQEITISVIVT